MSNRNKILVVDDEARMRKLVSDFLTRDGFEVVEAADGQEGLDTFRAQPDIDLIILDVMMPVMDGNQMCREVREGGSTIPIIMLTAKGEEEDELTGFDNGADEYITKPFSPKILVARVEAILRRSQPVSSENEPEKAAEVLESGGIVIDKTAHTVTVDDENVELSFKEFELLTFFMENEGIALSREKILSNVWNYDYIGDARTVDTHVKKLRSKLGGRGEAIRTIWGMGYKFEAV